MAIHQYHNPAALVDAFAQWLSQYIADTLKKQDRFTLCLSGGSTPKALHLLLSQAPYQTGIDWEKVHVFFGDERFVPFSDERNNAKMAFDTLLSHVAVPGHQIHVMATTGVSPEESAAAYEKLLHDYFDGQPQTFDLVLLGMGDDAHTLSLFPGTAVIDEQNAWTSSLWLESQNMFRVTLTAPVVNRAAAVAFLVTGCSKTAALRQVWNAPRNVHRFPAQIIQPSGTLDWWLDDAAAGH